MQDNFRPPSLTRRSQTVDKVLANASERLKEIARETIGSMTEDAVLKKMKVILENL